MLEKVFSKEALDDPKEFARLKQMMKSAYKDFKNGSFKDSELYHETKPYRSSLAPSQKPHSVAVRLYEWYKEQPTRLRKTTGSFYEQIEVLNDTLDEGEKPINVSVRKRMGVFLAAAGCVDPPLPSPPLAPPPLGWPRLARNGCREI